MKAPAREVRDQSINTNYVFTMSALVAELNKIWDKLKAGHLDSSEYAAQKWQRENRVCLQKALCRDVFRQPADLKKKQTIDMQRQDPRQDLKLTEAEFNKLLKESSNAWVEETAEDYRFKRAYPVSSIDELRDYLLKHVKTGVLDDDRLAQCYRGAAQDVQTLIDSGWLHVIEYQDSNVKSKDAPMKRVLFPCNLADKEVEDFWVHRSKETEYISTLWASMKESNKPWEIVL